MSVFAALILALATTLSGSSASTNVGDDPPPVFAALSFDDALARTVDTTTILVVKATAAWCQPCKQMDRTTWRDEKVVAWFKDNGLAIHFDVDEQSALAKKLDIQAMPTMIAFVKGKEFDRIIGYKKPVEFVAWLEGVKRGEKGIDAVKVRAKNAPKDSEEEVDARYALAQELARDGELDRATEEFAWVWVNSANAPGYGGVRGSFMVTDMQQLAHRHPPALERFKQLRDEAGKQIEQETVGYDDLKDWFALNKVVGEPSKTLEWFDRVKGEARWAPLLGRTSRWLDDLLLAQDRWSDMTVLHSDPLGELQREHELVHLSSTDPTGDSPKEQQDQMRTFAESRFRDTAGKLHAVLLSAGREDEAGKLVDESIKLDDSGAMRVTLVAWAVKAKQARPRHVELLNAAEQKDPKVSTKGVRKKLDALLAPQPPH